MQWSIWVISKRYIKANSKYLKSYDPKQESKHIIYLGTNNLYGYAMCKFLATGGFKWMEPEEFYLDKYTCKSSKVCILEVDLEYPTELSQVHSNYPPDKIEIKKMLSSDQLKISDLHNFPIGNVKELVSNFFN